MDGSSLYKQTRYFISEIVRCKIILQAALVGLIAGLLVVLFRFSIGVVHNWFYVNIVAINTPASDIFIIPLFAGFAGLISGMFVCIVPEIRGSGIPYVKMVLARMGCLIHLRSIFAKFIAGVFGIGFGLSLGREGPSVQIGGGAGALIGKLFKMKGTDKDKLIAAGAGSAIAATFNAPLAGTIFVLEELVNKFSSSLLFPVLIATVCADTLSRNLMGNKPCFIIPENIGTVGSVNIPACLILGVIAAFAGTLFAKIIFLNIKIFDKIKVPLQYKTLFAGLITGIAGVYFPLVMGSGGEAVDALLGNHLTFNIIIFLFVLKMLLTPLCFGAGAVGGIFLPTLMLGAFLGYIVSIIINMFGIRVDTALFSVLGMGAFLAAVARTPVTAAVMVFEMTGCYHFILPIMLCCAISDLTAEKLGNKPIYSKLIIEYSTKTGEAKILSEIKAEEALSKDFKYIEQDDILLNIINGDDTNSVYPVLNDKQKLCGYISTSHIKDLILQEACPTLKAREIMNPNPVTVLNDENLYVTYFRLHSYNVQSIFVVDKSNTLRGIITRDDILNIVNERQNVK